MVRVFVAIPTLGTVADSQVHALRKITQAYAGQVELVYPAQCVQRIFHDFARNGMVEEFLKTDCDILWFLDSDVTPPLHILDLVTKHGDTWKCAGAPYPILMTPAGYEHPQVVFTAYKNMGAKRMVPADIPSEGVEFVDGLATGCLFIKREVLVDMPKPYFQFQFNAETRQFTMGEDIDFCMRMADQGIQFLTDYSMICKHVKTVELCQMVNYARTQAHQAVENFHAQVKSQVQELARQNQELKRQLSTKKLLAV